MLLCRRLRGDGVAYKARSLLPPALAFPNPEWILPRLSG
jgi:hypothetical protein